MGRILSGIQPTGVPTLGNYLGAIRAWVDSQDEHECLYCIVDLHAVTAWQEPETLRRNTREVAASLLASGLDPARVILFHQSAVPAHARLAWLLNCVCRIGWLNRMTQFKDKAGRDREAASVGLWTYPVLMAADILAYHATLVPVGDDQRQHLELANDIRAKFNHDYGVDFFPEVQPMIGREAARVMSLRDGARKMSKSDPSDQSRVGMADDDDLIALKIRRARTDPAPLPSELAGLEDRPEARNLVAILAALTGETSEAGARRARRQGVRRVQGGAGGRADRDDRADPRPHAGAARGRAGARPRARRGCRTRGRDRQPDRRRGRAPGRFRGSVRRLRPGAALAIRQSSNPGPRHQSRATGPGFS